MLCRRAPAAKGFDPNFGSARVRPRSDILDPVVGDRLLGQERWTLTRAFALACSCLLAACTGDIAGRGGPGEGTPGPGGAAGTGGPGGAVGGSGSVPGNGAPEELPVPSTRAARLTHA